MTKYFLIFAMLFVGFVMSTSAGAVGEPPAVGAPAPEFSLTTNEGKAAA